MKPTTRRSFIARAAATLSVPLWPRVSALSFQARDAGRIKARPFELKQVRLRRGPFLDAAEVNRKYMASLNPDSLLHMFRVTAGLPSSAKPLGGWEQPENELRGHFTGHYLSACALMWAQTGDATVKTRGTLMVAELAKCQAKNGNGYLSAFPTELFDRLKAGQRVWAPFYTYHKIMAGLLDNSTLADNPQALGMVRGRASWA